MKNIRRVSLRRQAGNILLTTAAGLGVLGIAQVGSTKYMLAKASDAKGTAIGAQMADIQGMLDAYVTSHYPQLQQATPVVSGVADPMAPTLAELQALGLPNTSVLGAPAAGGTYQIRIATAPAGCSGTACNIRAKVWLDTPLTTDDGGPDIRVLGAAVAAGSGGLGFSLPADPTTITSSAGWAESNPDAAGRPGILMAATGYSASGLAAFMRRDGSTPPTASHNWNGQNLTNVGHAQASTLASTGEVYADGWYRSSRSGTGWYNEANQGGFYMSDPSWVRSYADKGIYTGGQMQAGSVQVNGNIVASGAVTAYATNRIVANDWSTVGLDAWGNHNAAAGSGVGSGYFNDVFIRAVGRWASQMGGTLHGNFTAGQMSYRDESGGPYSYVTTCPHGSVMTGLDRREPEDAYYLICAYIN